MDMEAKTCGFTGLKINCDKPRSRTVWSAPQAKYFHGGDVLEVVNASTEHSDHQTIATK